MISESKIATEKQFQAARDLIQQSIANGINLLFPEEKVIFAILASDKRPKRIGEIQEDYLDHLLANIDKNWKLISSIDIITSFLTYKTKIENWLTSNRGVAHIPELIGIFKEISDAKSLYHDPDDIVTFRSSVAEKLKASRHITAFLLKRTQYSVILSHGAIQNILRNLEAFGLVTYRLDQRATKSGKLKDWSAYALIEKAQNDWDMQRVSLLEKIKLDPNSAYNIEELRMYGLCNELLDLRLKSIEPITSKIKDAIYKIDALFPRDNKEQHGYVNVSKSELEPLKTNLDTSELLAYDFAKRLSTGPYVDTLAQRYLVPLAAKIDYKVFVRAYG
jgi:hypothetical protein